MIRVFRRMIGENIMTAVRRIIILELMLAAADKNTLVLYTVD